MNPIHSQPSWTDDDRERLIALGLQITSTRKLLESLNADFLALVNKKRSFELASTPVKIIPSHITRKPSQASKTKQAVLDAIKSLPLDKSVMDAIMAVLK